jgi:rhodanese-related sulfurtransferase
MFIFKYLIPIVLATPFWANQSENANLSKSEKANAVDLLPLRFQNVRGKQFTATVAQRFQESTTEKELKQIYELKQNCLADGFRHSVTNWNVHRKDPGETVMVVSETLWIPDESYISVMVMELENGTKNKERPKYNNDRGRSLVSIPTTGMSLIGLIWDGQRTWDLTDREFWAQATITELDSGDQARLKVPSGVELEIGIKSTGNDELEFTFRSSHSGRLVVTSYRWNHDHFLGMTSEVQGADGYRQLIDLKTTFEAKDDGIREFSIVDVRIGDEVVAILDENLRYEYLGNGKAKPVIDSESEQKIKDLYEKSSKKMPMPSKFDAEFDRSSYLRSRNNSSHCGIYALAGLYALQGEWVPVSELFDNARENDELLGPHGTSAGGMISDLRKRGFHASVVNKMGLGFLDLLNAPAILHFGQSYQAEGTSHWVLFLGKTSVGEYRILDLPRGESAVDGPLLLSYWSGSAIVASKGEDGISSLVLRHRIIQVTKYFAYIAIPMCCLIGFSTTMNKQKRKTLVLHIFGPILLATLMSTAWHSYAKASPARSRIAGAVVRHKSNITVERQLPRCTCDVLLESNVTIVDCRLPGAFEIGHITGAINLPVDASLGELRDVVLGLDANSTIICYCLSENCQWADRVAGLLHDIGAHKCFVLDRGWIGYLEWLNKKS